MCCLKNIKSYLNLATGSAEYNCEYKKDGFYSDDDFCHIYWRCNYGVAEEYECPAGTAWNHKEGRCDWLDNVDCTRLEDGNKKSGKASEDDDDEPAETTKKAKNKSNKKTTPEPEEAAPAEEETQDTFDEKIGKLFAKA